MRGLGIGIVITALILIAVDFQNNKGEMTDAQIKERAAELGMVDANSFSLTDAAQTSKDTDASFEGDTVEEAEAKTEGNAEAKENAEAEGNAEAKENAEAKNDKTAESAETVNSETENAEEAKAETKDETKEEIKEETKEAAEPEKPAPVTESGTLITITIERGASSETAAAVLAGQGLVEDATDFNKYMIQNGYDRRIHPGTYQIEVGTSYEDICRIIAG